jgi:hypothetical protein
VLSKARIRRLFEVLFTWTAIAVPGVAASGRVAVDAVWRDDLALVRGLAFAPVAGPATVTSVAMQAASLLPLGPLPYRMALVSAAMLSMCAWAIVVLARRVLEAHVPSSLLNVPLACIAAMTATLGPALQGEATVAGGATTPLAVSLLVWLAVTATDTPRLQRWTWAGGALGLLLSESYVAVLAMCAAMLVATAVRGDWPRGRAAWIPGVTAVVSALVFMLPAALRPLAPHRALDFGHGVHPTELVPLDVAAQTTTALRAWNAEVGTISLVLAGLGLVAGVLRKRTRWYAAPLALLVLVDVAFPATTGAMLAPDMLAPLRALAITAVAVAASLGVHVVVHTLMDMGLPMARAAAVLVVIFNLTLVAVTAERAAFCVDRSGARGASAYADEALRRLPPNAMVLARSNAVMWRLLADCIVSGARPDVVLVAYPLVGRARVANQVLAAEPSASVLLRDMVMEGTPGEHGVSRVADRRPLFVELDPLWDARVAVHLAPSGLWLQLHPQPLGRSDRRMAIEGSAQPFARMMALVRATETADPATEAVVLTVARQQTVAAALARDVQATRDLLERLAAVAPSDLFVRAMRQRLDHAKGSEIDVAGLVR